MFFLIHSNEDGDVRVDQMTRDELVARLNDNYWGDITFAASLDDLGSDPMYWGNKAVLIDGATVVPQPEQVITSWTV